MTNNTIDEVAGSPQDETRRGRKKQAKREAKLMLKLEGARKDVEKAEQKLAKVQSKLEARNARLHDLETRLAQARITQDQPGPTEPEQHETPQSEKNTETNSAQPEQVASVASTSSTEAVEEPSEDTIQSEKQPSAEEPAAFQAEHEQQDTLSTNEDASSSDEVPDNREKPVRRRARRTSQSSQSTEDAG